jgi:outer membrane protein OmpA-like peptidoglycan-associated protein
MTHRSPSLRWLVLALAAVACAPPARPPAMARVAEVRASPAAAEAETWAPQAHAHALELEERAERALQGGDAEAASLLAEQAIAAHEHAWVLTRLARAERRRLEAEAELDEQRRVLGEVRALHQRLAAEAAALELRSQVARSALPLPPHEAARPERQLARRRAAGTLSAQARLLCVGARLLGAGERVEPLLSRLDALDQKVDPDQRVAGGTGPKLLETAAELRGECQRVISEIRQKNTAPAARPGGMGSVPADVVLDELSAVGAAPSRDERGVAVSLRDLFAADGGLTEPARAELKRLGQIANQHPDFPVLLVGHSASARGAGEVDQELAAVSSALAGSGVVKIEVWSVADREPLLPPRSPAASARNQRIELVFVAPGF